MKKAFLLPLLLGAIALPSCINSQQASSEIPLSDSSAASSAPLQELGKLKALLSKQDTSPIYNKMFVSGFTQDYKAYTSIRNEDGEVETGFYTYNGAGWFGCFYEVGEEAYEEAEALANPDFFDYLSRGFGDYGLIQGGSLVSYSYELEDEKVANSLQCLDFMQEVEARFDEENVQVVNSLFTKDTLDGGFDIDSRQYFNGIIDKATLFDTITVRAFSDIFARTNLFDGQRSCEILDRIYLDLVKELSGKSDDELGDFIAKNDIRIEDEEENTLVHFKVGDESLRAILDEHDIIPGDFEGTLTYEKESGEFTAFDYGILYSINELDGDNIHTASMEFKATGYSRNQIFDGGLYIDPDPTVYEDAEVFLNDVVEEVIPPVF